MKRELHHGVVARAEPRHSYYIRRDDGVMVVLTRREANTTNFRMQVGDALRFDVYRSGGRLFAFDVTFVEFPRGRKPIIPPPPYYALGPVMHCGRVPTGMMR